MSRNLLKSKHSQSQVIATVILILLCITAVAIIAGFVIPMVKEKIKESDCFDTVGLLEIDTEDGYCCYDDSAVRVSVMRKNKDAEIDGFLIAIHGDGDSKSFEIKNGEISGVKMLDGTKDIEIPGKSEKKTYDIEFTGTPEKAIIAPILNGVTCDVTDEAEVVEGC